MTEPDVYCREIETYLCRKNEGHLIRIVGPAFEQVCGWAARGIPLKVAFRGIDQYCDRYYAKGARRRPVRIEFCEADILDLFDAWRRAVGVAVPHSSGSADGAVEERAPRRPALAAHIERVVARLATLRGGGQLRDSLAAHIDGVVRELENLASQARGARGESRARIIQRLEEIDRQLMATSANQIDAVATDDLNRQVDDELGPFGARMPAEALERARRAAFETLLRETLRLPIVAYE
jgi:hypothetical protein